MNKVLLIGCGHMGSALLDSWLDLKSYYFTIIDPFNYKYLKSKYKSNKVEILNSIPSQKQVIKYNIIIFAVKPQVASKAINEYKNFKFKNNSIIASIIAGKKINFYKKYLKSSNQFVRIMPNMPAQIKEGITCLVGSNNLNKVNKNKIDKLFLKVGKTIWFKNEAQIDKATAISGSGPGYIYTLIDAFEKGSIKIGLSKAISRKLVLQTILGSVKLMEKTNYEPDQLANTIAVKGGTTEAGIKILKKDNIKKTIYNTLKVAYRKASILGKKNND